MAWAILLALILLIAAFVVHTAGHEIAHYDEMDDDWVVPSPDSVSWLNERQRAAKERAAEYASRRATYKAEQEYHRITVNYGENDCYARCEALGCGWADVQPTGTSASTARGVLEYRFAHHLAEVEQQKETP